jgi:hypothetical protein
MLAEPLRELTPEVTPMSKIGHLRTQKTQPNRVVARIFVEHRGASPEGIREGKSKNEEAGGLLRPLSPVIALVGLTGFEPVLPP